MYFRRRFWPWRTLDRKYISDPDLRTGPDFQTPFSAVPRQPCAERRVDIDVLPPLRADRVRHVRADPRMAHAVFEQMIRHPPWRIRDDELGHAAEKPCAFRRVGQHARLLVEPIEFRQIEARVVLGSRRSIE